MHITMLSWSALYLGWESRWSSKGKMHCLFGDIKPSKNNFNCIDISKRTFLKVFLLLLLLLNCLVYSNLQHVFVVVKSWICFYLKNSQPSLILKIFFTLFLIIRAKKHNFKDIHARPEEELVNIIPRLIIDLAKMKCCVYLETSDQIKTISNLLASKKKKVW